MFTNDEIRSAMDGLVKAKGENHTSYGRFADPEGHGACFLGALAEFMGMKVPGEGTPARNVLGKGAISDEMEVAFSLAMHLNDQHFEWKYVLRGVDLVLEHGLKGIGKCDCGCQSPDFQKIIEQVKAERALDKNQEVRAYVKKAAGGIITQVPAGLMVKDISLTNLSSAMGYVTFSTAGASTSITNFTQAFADAGLAKKDHALTA